MWLTVLFFGQPNLATIAKMAAQVKGQSTVGPAAATEQLPTAAGAALSISCGIELRGKHGPALP